MKPIAPQRHSEVVGGSTAAQILHCPGSAAICKKMPNIDTSSTYSREGSMLHAAIAQVIEQNTDPVDMIGFSFLDQVLTEELYEEKLKPAVDAFDYLLDELEDTYGGSATVLVEREVTFGSYIPGAFGSCDITVKIGPRAIILDWKFGRGVPVSVEENEQLMFYAAAAMRTPGIEISKQAEFELIIVQPTKGEPSRWLTTPQRLKLFEKDLKAAVKESKLPDAPLCEGPWCRWCKGQPECPLMNGAMARAAKLDLDTIDIRELGLAIEQSYVLETFIEKLRNLGHKAMEEGVDIPGCKLVQKRAQRKWVDELTTLTVVRGVLDTNDIFKDAIDTAEHDYLMEAALYEEPKVLSVTQMEKSLKKYKLEIPEGLVKSVSSGTTLALESDPRPSVAANIQLAKALKKLR